MADEKSYDSCRAEYKLKANRYLSREGYNRGGAIRGPKKDEDIAQDKKMVEKGVHQHEGHMHKGQGKTKLKLKDGGEVHGEKPNKRLDRYARGGKVGHKGGTKVNVIVAPQAPNPASALPTMPPRPVVPPAGAMGPKPPMGGMPPGVKRGGAIK